MSSNATVTVRSQLTELLNSSDPGQLDSANLLRIVCSCLSTMVDTSRKERAVLSMVGETLATKAHSPHYAVRRNAAIDAKRQFERLD